MKTYCFESVSCASRGGGAKISFEGHREAICAYAKQGMVYVGWIPTAMDGYGHITAMDLIFEGKKEAL